MLIADLINEEKRGTMNFIRLSPRSPRQIFIGKILGVPVLVYMAVAWMIPLNLLAVLNVTEGSQIYLFISLYIMIVSLWFLLSSAAILYVLLGGGQAIVTTIAIAAPIGCFFQGYGYIPSMENWFGLSFRENPALTWGFESIVFLSIGYWVWQALERRYLNPNATAISKSQSYLINIGLQVLLAGFALPFLSYNSYSDQYLCATLVAIDFTLLTLSTPLILPSTQILQDWSRYRRERKTTQHLKFWQRELVQDLLFDDKSPALLSIAINIGMALVLWIPISLFFTQERGIEWKFLACVCFAASLTLIYAAIAHLVLFLNVKKHNLWTMGIITVVATLPIGVGSIISSGGSLTGLAAILLLFSPYAPAAIWGASGEIIFGSLVAQVGLLAILTRQLQRKLQISGQSHTKELLARS